MNVRIARLCIAFYPLAFRRRYGQEMEALIAESRPGGRGIVDLLAGAMRAHLRPPRGLTVHTNDRLRLSASAVLACWVVFAAAGFGFYKTTEGQSFMSAGYAHQLLGDAHDTVQTLAGLASIVLIMGAAPLIALAVRQAARTPRLRGVVSVPPLAVLAFIALTAALTLAARSPAAPGFVGHAAFVVWGVAGLLCGAACVIGARIALFATPASRETLRMAMGAASLVTLGMIAIAASTIIYAIVLHLDAPGLAAAANGPFGAPDTLISIVIQAIVMALAAGLASVATLRGLRAMRPAGHRVPAS